ncbi:tryptophan synthase beta subunit-like PLP-dependent enzyme [Wolfiporia cocos MD-104 SS10]|uniref:L-serine ammonia-lyase n=1 Tax=Wolfiporia cocos (strain MD-104) TaxID=742152 RepID=A0A2H3J7J3_WOLCO|nr:tryptophan synthase beta subunit-like PLP-dependent enzyme [Wolfiporia cocos MD-104 SS10]
MPDFEHDSGKLWLETPLIYSPHYSARLGSNVYLKLENLQPCHSFKYRGITHFIQDCLHKHGREVHLVIASGGNAGLAAAYAARALGVHCTVYMPNTAGNSTIAFIKAQGAKTVVVGNYYVDAFNAAEEAIKSDPLAVMVPAYDDPLVWEGHGSMIDETARQLPAGTKPDAIFCSVGGGGLLGGVMSGCRAVGWDDVPLVTLETYGCNCFYQTLAVNPGIFATPSSDPPEGVSVVHDTRYDVDVAHLSSLTSRAACLAASSPAAGVVANALKWKGGIKSVCVPDELAMVAALDLAETHKLLVELACSTVLTPAYAPAILDQLMPPKASGEARTVVFIICGGFKVTLKELEEYRQIIDADLRNGKEWDVACNGEKWEIEKWHL